MSKILIPLMVMISLLHSDIYTRGERVFATVCDGAKLQSLSYKDRDELKSKITSNHICKRLNKKNLDALIYYLANRDKHQAKREINTPKDAKCPVCGMWVHKYPKWASMIEIDGKKLYFDGVKDMMKFYFDPIRFHQQKRKIDNMEVSDYYTLKAIPAKDAYYVIGSNIYGPMGEELIPFEKKEDAINFKADHDGKKILRFEEIKESYLY